MDGRVLSEILDPAFAAAAAQAEPVAVAVAEAPIASGYTEEEDAEIQQRLADLGYL